MLGQELYNVNLKRICVKNCVTLILELEHLTSIDEHGRLIPPF